MLPILRPYLLRVFPTSFPLSLPFYWFLHVSSFTSFLLHSYLTFSIFLPFFLASFLLPLLPPLLFTFFIPFLLCFTSCASACFLSSSFPPLLHLCLCLPSLLTCSFLFFFSFFFFSFLRFLLPLLFLPFFPFPSYSLTCFPTFLPFLFLCTPYPSFFLIYLPSLSPSLSSTFPYFFIHVFI